MSVSYRADISEYSNRVLGVIKEKYGLKDKTEALDKFAELYGEEFVEKELKEEFVNEILEITRDEEKKHSKRRMTLKQLDKLSGV